MTVLIKQIALIVVADVLHSARTGGVSFKRLVAILPHGPFFILKGPVAGEAPGGPFMGVIVGVVIPCIIPPVMICSMSVHVTTMNRKLVKGHILFDALSWGW